MKGRRSKHANIDLGLAVSAISLQPGQRRTCEQLAAFCGCTRQNISVIEQRALKKVRLALYLDKTLQNDLNHCFKR